MGASYCTCLESQYVEFCTKSVAFIQTLVRVCLPILNSKVLFNLWPLGCGDKTWESFQALKIWPKQLTQTSTTIPSKHLVCSTYCLRIKKREASMKSLHGNALRKDLRREEQQYTQKTLTSLRWRSWPCLGTNIPLHVTNCRFSEALWKTYSEPPNCKCPNDHQLAYLVESLLKYWVRPKHCPSHRRSKSHMKLLHRCKPMLHQSQMRRCIPLK